MWKFRTWQGLIVGIGIGLAGSVVWPRLRARMQNNSFFAGLTGAMATGTTKVQENVRKWTDAIKEEAQDLVAEAQYEKMRQEINRDISEASNEDKEDRLPPS